jgi:hypothetical protein
MLKCILKNASDVREQSKRGLHRRRARTANRREQTFRSGTVSYSGAVNVLHKSVQDQRYGSLDLCQLGRVIQKDESENFTVSGTLSR